MTAGIRDRLTYANVAATLALFLALGGGIAWALEANSVRSKHIVNGQVKAQDLSADNKTMWALIDGSTGDVVRSSGGVTNKHGFVDIVGFPKSLQGRAVIATVKDDPPTPISVHLCADHVSDEASPCGAPGDPVNNSRHVFVESGDTVTRDFYIAALAKN